MNGKCGSLAIPVDMSVAINLDQLSEELSKSITSINSDHNNNNKSVTRKTCTCSSGLVLCSYPYHSGTATNTNTNTERTSINGYTNGFIQFPSHKIKTSVQKINSMKPIKQEPRKNGKIIPEENTKQAQMDYILSSSRTYTSGHKMNDSNVNGRDLSVNSNIDELRLSLTSLLSKDETNPNEVQATEAFQKWLAEKKRQEREIRQRESNLKQLIKQERERKIQMEQENFQNWLQVKKQKEKQEKETKKKVLEEEQRRKQEKLKREEINKKQYQLWLKLKEEQDLVKKINEQKRKIEKEERERQRLTRNQSAFQDWLISSKDKPKPVPLNQGLESLRTSTSVAFINPAPWVPNIVEKTKAKCKSK